MAYGIRTGDPTPRKDVVRSSVKVPKFDKHMKKFGGHIGRNVGEITIKMETIVRKPLMIKIIKFRLRNLDSKKLFHLFIDDEMRLLVLSVKVHSNKMFSPGFKQSHFSFFFLGLCVCAECVLLVFGLFSLFLIFWGPSVFSLSLSFDRLNKPLRNRFLLVFSHFSDRLRGTMVTQS